MEDEDLMADPISSIDMRVRVYDLLTSNLPMNHVCCTESSAHFPPPMRGI